MWSGRVAVTHSHPGGVDGLGGGGITHYWATGDGCAVVSPSCDQEQPHQQHRLPHGLGPRRGRRAWLGRRRRRLAAEGGSLGNSLSIGVCGTFGGGGGNGFSPHVTRLHLPPPHFWPMRGSTARVPSHGCLAYRRIGEASNPGPPDPNVVPPTHHSAPGRTPRPTGEPRDHLGDGLGDDGAHSEVWDDERLCALLDSFEREPGDCTVMCDDSFDLPYPLCDVPSPPSPQREGDHTMVQEAHCGAMHYTLDDPFGDDDWEMDDGASPRSTLAADRAWESPPSEGDLAAAMDVGSDPQGLFGNVAFVASRRFNGRRQGYVFRTGD